MADSHATLHDMLPQSLADELKGIRERLTQIDASDPEGKDDALWQEATTLLARVRDLSALALAGRT